MLDRVLAARELLLLVCIFYLLPTWAVEMSGGSGWLFALVGLGELVVVIAAVALPRTGLSRFISFVAAVSVVVGLNIVLNLTWPLRI